MNLSTICSNSSISDMSENASTSPNCTCVPVNGTDLRDEGLARLEIGVLGLIFVMIIFGNLSVLVALVAGRLKMRRMYYFLLHLSIADLFTGFFTVLPQLAWDITYRFYGGNIMCKSIKYLQILGPYLSSYVLVVTAIDRYQAICFPLANCTWTARRSKLMITVAWLISLLCCAPQPILFSYQRVSEDGVVPEVYDCWGTFPERWGQPIYVTWYSVTVFFVPLVVITFTYVCICREIWLNAKRNAKFNKAIITPNSNHVNSSAVATANEVDSTASAATRGKSPRRKNQRLIVEVGANYRFRSSQANANVRCFVEEVSNTSSEETTSRHSVSSRYNVNLITPRSHCCPGKLSRAKIKTIKITVVVIACYVFCSLPFICVQLWVSWLPIVSDSEPEGSLNSTTISDTTGCDVVTTDDAGSSFITIAMLLSSLNSCVNPWIYLFFNRNLFNTLKKICCHPFTKFRPVRPNVNEFNSSMHSEAYTGNTVHHDSGRERLGTGASDQRRLSSSSYQLSPNVCKSRRQSFDADPDFTGNTIATNLSPILPSLLLAPNTSSNDQNFNRTRAQINGPRVKSTLSTNEVEAVAVIETTA